MDHNSIPDKPGLHNPDDPKSPSDDETYGSGPMVRSSPSDSSQNNRDNGESQKPSKCSNKRKKEDSDCSAGSTRITLQNVSSNADDDNEDEHNLHKHAHKIGTILGTSKAREKPWYKDAERRFKESMSMNLNKVSYLGKKQISSTYNHRTVSESADEPLETNIDPKLYCKHCKQLNVHCHNRIYSDYITKKMFSMYSNKIDNPGYDKMKKQMELAYNEKRRCNYYDRFEFYDSAHAELPWYLEYQSFTIAKMIQEVVVATRINHETREGVVKLLRAKRFRKA